MLCSGLTGCLEESDDGFDWPIPTEFSCNLSSEYNLECKMYIEGLETPHHSISHPENGDL